MGRIRTQYHDLAVQGGSLFRRLVFAAIAIVIFLSVARNQDKKWNHQTYVNSGGHASRTLLATNDSTTEAPLTLHSSTTSKIHHTSPLIHTKTTTPSSYPSSSTSNEGEVTENVTRELGTTTINPMDICTSPAYHEFPPDLFNNYQRSHGAIVVHILVIVYMFYAVAVVCDDYFVASLEECCARLYLSEDVAGATFMAAGSSAPELFTAILGVLVAKGDVGTGTIVGSAVFNVLFVIGICGLFSGRLVELSWWPLFRDSVFYSLTVVILILIIYDSEVTWYESLIMMIIYSIYILIMKYNHTIHMFMNGLFGIQEEMTAKQVILNQGGDKKSYSSYVPFNNEIDDLGDTTAIANRSIYETIRDPRKRSSMYEAALKIMMSRHFRPKTRFRSLVLLLMLEQQRLKNTSRRLHTQISLETTEGVPRYRSKSISLSIAITDDYQWKRLPRREDGPLGILKWCVQAPLTAVLHYTIPDCRKDEYRRWFLLTFTMSIVWTAIFSYVMVWMVTLVGYTLRIPDSIMGITFLAAGTSVPDAFASLIVSKQGQGDMAVSNSIGSNIFDILIGLAFPWFIQTAMIEPGSIATINSKGMVYSVVLLFLTIIIAIAGIYFSHWQLTPKLGVVLLVVYGVFLVISCSLEFNLLGDVNPPMCPE